MHLTNADTKYIKTFATEKWHILIKKLAKD